MKAKYSFFFAEDGTLINNMSEMELAVCPCEGQTVRFVYDGHGDTEGYNYVVTKVHHNLVRTFDGVWAQIIDVFLEYKQNPL